MLLKSENLIGKLSLTIEKDDGNDCYPEELAGPFAWVNHCQDNRHKKQNDFNNQTPHDALREVTAKLN